MGIHGFGTENDRRTRAAIFPILWTLTSAGGVPAPDAAPRWDTLWAALILAAALAAYHNSFGGPLIFDDPPSILRQPHDPQALADLAGAACPPSRYGRRPPAGGQPLPGHQLRPGGNQRLGLPPVQLRGPRAGGLDPVRRDPPYAAAACRWPSSSAPRQPLALIAALIWTVHPLQTNAVTYIIQRTEVLAGLFYLLTLYCVIRGAVRVGDRGQDRGTEIATVCFLFPVPCPLSLVRGGGGGVPVGDGEQGIGRLGAAGGVGCTTGYFWPARGARCGVVAGGCTWPWRRPGA